MTIRPLQPGDRAGWEELWRGYLAFYETERPEEVFDTTFARLLDPDANEFRCLLACINEAPVGLVHFLSHRHCWHVGNVFYLQDLFVSQSVRGRGAGRALIMAVREIAERENAPAVYWLTHETNAVARALYDRLAQYGGFIKYQMNL